MKLITAIVRPEKLDELVDAVIDSKGRGITVTEVRGFGRQYGELAAGTAGPDVTADGLPRSRRAALLGKVRLDVLVPDEDLQAMVDAIARHARTGVIGDGKIWVSPIDSVLRVRTGEADSDAI